jgi:SPP1 family predicted phage head-tail adaptor
MKPGILRQRVIIQTPTITTDASGISSETWATFAEVFAAVEPLKMREYLAAAATTSKIDVRIRIRHLAGLLPTMRISYDDKYYKIVSIINVGERDREHELLAVEV